MNIVCHACKQEIDRKNIIYHHTSYFPEIQVPVHRSCHFKIHRGIAYQELCPTRHQILKFYGEKHIINTKLNKEMYEKIINLSKTNDRSISAQLRVMIKGYSE